jgi:hypothetical protein
MSISARSSITSSLAFPLATGDNVDVSRPPSVISSTINAESEADLALPEMLDPQKIYKVRTSQVESKGVLALLRARYHQ